MTKYEPLTRFLAAREESRLPLSFEQIERTLGFSLPDSARRYRPWWANQSDSGHSQTRGWMDAGWKTADVDMADERVVFVREGGVSRRDNRVGDGLRRSPDLRADHDGLTPAARRLLDDYTRQADGDEAAALARALHEAAVARRNRLIAQAVAQAPRVLDDSVDLVREGRDAR